MELGIVVIDADELFRHQIRSIVDSVDECELLAECESVEQAKQAAANCSPNIVFVDARLPGLDMLLSDKNFNGSVSSLHIFVAPDESYALKAIKARAFDYLVKPVEATQLMTTLGKAAYELRYRHGGELEHGIVESVRPTRGDGYERLVVRTGGRFIFVRTSEIDWIEAARNYVRIHAGSESYLEHRSISSLEKILDPGRFVRIHRSVIVNVDKIKELRCWPTGEYVVLMQNGKELTLSRGYRGRLPLLLGRPVLLSQSRECDVAGPSQSQFANSA